MAIKLLKEGKLSPGEKEFFQIGSQEVVVLNIDGEDYAVQNRCPHMAGPLGRGRADSKQKTISCPFHGWKFDISTGISTNNAPHKVRTYDVTVEDGYIAIA
jgi:nitrite reductase/ring-hydroxylating ferredoxin subunit